jgi:hypothetical protein
VPPFAFASDIAGAKAMALDTQNDRSHGWVTYIDTNRAMVDLLERFCGGFTAGDAAAVTAVCDMSAGLTIVTSEEPILRGAREFSAFLDRYAHGSTRYAWRWDHHEVMSHGDVACMLATGIETAINEGVEVSHPYRMTVVAVRVGESWMLVQAHGSSPH